MAYALRAYWQDTNSNGIVDRIEIHQEGFSGSTIEFTHSKGFELKHNYAEGEKGLSSVQENRIIEGVLTWNPYIDSAAKQTLIEDIADSTATEFRVVLKRDGSEVWYGFPSSRVFSYPEDSSYFATLQFRDFEYLKNVAYPLDDSRQTLITTIAELLNYTGFGWDITTATSWQERNTTTTDDFLNQVYHDTYGLRDYGRNGDETDAIISVYDALERVAEPVLIIMQWEGFLVRQVSAYADPSVALISVYNSSGVQSSSASTDVRYTGYKDINSGTPALRNTSQNKNYPALNAAKVKFNHRFQTFGLSVPSTVTLNEATAENGAISCSTTGTGVTGTSTSFLADVNVGDELWAYNGDFLEQLGTVSSITSNTVLNLANNAAFTFSGADWYINATQNARYTQQFVSDGTQSIRYSINCYIDGGNWGAQKMYSQWVLKIGSYWYDYDNDNWTTTQTINQVSAGNPPFGRSVINGETALIPDAADGELLFLLMYPEDENGSTQYVNSCEFRNTELNIYEKTAAGASTQIEYTLTNPDEQIEVVDLGTDYYGDSVYEYGPPFFRYGTGESELTSGWRRRGESTYLEYHRLKLREVLDFQRTRTVRKIADVYGDMQPEKILVYDSKNWMYVGGIYNGNWRPVLIHIREQTASDTYANRYLTDTSGNSGSPTAADTISSGDGLTETEADGLYLQIENDLSDLDDASTARTNLGLGSLAVQNNINNDDWSGADLEIANGGTGASSAGAARSNLGLAIGSDIQAWSSNLDSINQDLGTGDDVSFQTITASHSSYPVGKFERTSSTTGGALSGLGGIASAFMLKTTSTGDITDGFGGGLLFVLNDDTETDENNIVARIYARRDGSDSAGALQFFVNNNSLGATLRASGFMGLGTEAPDEMLHVTGNSIIEGNLNIEGGLFASEFVVNQTRVQFDNAMSVGGGKIGSVSGSAGSETITFEDEDRNKIVPVAVNDILHIKRVTGFTSGTIVKNIWRKVSSISTNDVNLTTIGITWTTGDDTGSIAVADHVVVKGNVSEPDRDHYIKYDLSGTNAPNRTIYDNVTDVEDDGDIVLRDGNLAGTFGFSSGASIFGLGIGDSSLAGNYLYFTKTSAALKLDTFKINTDGIDIDSEGTGIPDVNEVASDTTASASFKSATSGSRFTSDALSISSSQNGKYIRIKFSYTITGGDASYDIRLRPQLQKISDNAWVDALFTNAVKTYPSVSSPNFDSNSSSTVSDTSTVFLSEFRLQETASSASGDYVIYLDATDTEIDYTTYDNIRLSVFNQGGAEVSGSFSASVEINVYKPATGVYPDGLITRLTDTMYQELNPGAGEYKIYQDTSLIT